MNRVVALLLVLLLVVSPYHVSGQNEGVTGTVDVRVMAKATSTKPFEYVGIRFSTTGVLSLDLSGFTIRDESGLRYTFGDVVLSGEEEVVLCQNTATSSASGFCDYYWTGGAIWNNDGDTFYLFDHTGVELTSIVIGDEESGQEVADTFDVVYEEAKIAELSVVSPGEDGLTLSGVEKFEAMYMDDNDVVNEIDWKLLSGNCDTGELVLSPSNVATGSYSYSEPELIVEIDTESLSNGEYCFVVDRVEQEGEEDMRETRTFLVNRYIEPTYQVRGAVYRDNNGDGHYNGTDTPVFERVVIAREVEGSIIATTTTNADGQYVFDLNHGDWIINDVIPIWWVQTGVIKNGIEIYSLPKELATTSQVSCSLSLSETDESGGQVVSYCDFLSVEKDIPTEESAITTPFNPYSSSNDTKTENRSQPVPRILGISSSTPNVCGKYLNSYLGPNWLNPTFEVMKLQLFLTSVGFFTPTSGDYDITTIYHVKALQAKEKTQILDPWVKNGIVKKLEPTGYVYKTTRAFINNQICPGSEVVELP